MEEEPRLMVDPSFNSLDGLGERFPPMARVRARFPIPASALASSLWIMMGALVASVASLLPAVWSLWQCVLIMPFTSRFRIATSAKIFFTSKAGSTSRHCEVFDSSMM